MSLTTSMVCDDCKVKWWAGQYHARGEASHQVYRDDLLTNFLFRHRNHKLRYVTDSDDEELMDYRSLDDSELEPQP